MEHLDLHTCSLPLVLQLSNVLGVARVLRALFRLLELLLQIRNLHFVRRMDAFHLIALVRGHSITM